MPKGGDARIADEDRHADDREPLKHLLRRQVGRAGSGRRSVLWTTTVLVALGIGFFSGSVYRQSAQAGSAARSDLLSALGRVATAELTLALLEQERPHELELRSRRELIDNIEIAYRAIESGASFGKRDDPPLMTRG